MKGAKSLHLHKYFVEIIWGAGNEKQGRYLRRAQATLSETKRLSLGENNLIHRRYYESFCVNHWERASLQYSQWESSTGCNGNPFNQSLGHWFQRMRLLHQTLQWWSRRLPEHHQATKDQDICFWSWQLQSVKQKQKPRFSIKDPRSLWKHLVHTLWADLDMEQILSYSLTPVPLSMGHVNGTMQKTPKSRLKKELHQIHLQTFTWP